MKRSRVTEEQIIAVPRGQEVGVAVADLCRKHGLSSPDLLQVEGQVRRPGCVGGAAAESVGDEHAKLKRMLADGMLNNVALKDLLEKNSEAGRASGGCSLSAADL